MIEIQFNTLTFLESFIKFDSKIEVKIPDEVINEMCRNLPNVFNNTEEYDTTIDAIRIARNELNKKQLISALEKEIKNRICLRVLHPNPKESDLCPNLP